ncbi:Membrane protein insertase YidC [Beijerinckiaceae bacterium RH AL1]|nr:membrane protein insertase YidC [Beijerinckiaceae bacterium]VVB49529.1 Membrane protein insertase YidC [Beijerinckiaceae bacterium RH CH11]VVB49609.1 Membrane protein insertase YidC [Beijerinckiaceae bacterium RH AL8]VVC56950.1 Membrane protein insertase YidC [Beijerinckiaceae bacterium RH AL1]
MKPDTKNYYLALALSILVIFGWNYFYAKPQLDKSRQLQTQPNAMQTAKPGSVSSLPPQSVNAPPQGGPVSESPAVMRDRKAVLADSPRITIDTPALEGSVALKGGRLDDLALKDYRETPDKNSPNIVLLTPSGAPSAYYAESGFVGQVGADVPLPGPDTQWTAAAGQKLTPTMPVTLTWDNGKGLVFTRKIAVDPNYMFTITNSVANKGGAPVTLSPYSLIVRQGLPKTSGYSVLHEGYVGVVGDSGVKETTYSAIEKEPGETLSLKGTGGWAGFTDKYWATALVPDQTQSFEASFQATGPATDRTYQTATIAAPVTIAAGAEASSSSHIFAGAKVVTLLDQYKDKLGIEKFDLMIDWGWFYFITKPMFFLIDGLYKVLGNFGLAIIGVTFLVKLVFFPLANRSYASMAKMKAVQPQLAALKEKYPDDKVRQQQEMMAIYKAEKINPVAGCLPMLIQIPVFFALYKVLFVTIEMRQAPFYLWIRDLSQPDPTNVFNLFGLLPFNPTTLPVVGHFLAIGILPLIMGVSMFLQMKMNPEPTDPVQKTMFSWMPVIFTFMLGTFPSGLVLYWTVNNTLTIIQQSVIMKRAGVKLELFDNIKSMFGAKPSSSLPKPANDTKKKPADSGSKAPAE